MTEEQKRIEELEAELKAYREAENIRFVIAYGEELEKADKTNKLTKLIYQKLSSGVVLAPKIGLAVRVNGELMPLPTRKERINELKQEFEEEYNFSKEAIEDCLEYLYVLYIMHINLNSEDTLAEIKKATGVDVSEANIDKCIPFVSHVAYIREEMVNAELDQSQEANFIDDIYYIAMSQHFLRLSNVSEDSIKYNTAELLDISAYGDYYKVNEDDFREVYEQTKAREEKLLKIKFARAREYVLGIHDEMERKREEEFKNVIEKKLEEDGYLDEINRLASTPIERPFELDVEKMRALFADIDSEEAITLGEVADFYQSVTLEDFEEGSETYEALVKIKKVFSTLSEEDYDVKVPRKMFFGSEDGDEEWNPDNDDDDDDDWNQ